MLDEIAFQLFIFDLNSWLKKLQSNFWLFKFWRFLPDHDPSL